LHVGQRRRIRGTAAAIIRPQVILMDIAMPGMDGYEAARRIRAQSPDMKVRIVALTGLGQQLDRLHSAEAGIDHHLVKPLDLQVLQPILDFHLEARGCGLARRCFPGFFRS
jgi:CheY-like chemotaxis protein